MLGFRLSQKSILWPLAVLFTAGWLVVTWTVYWPKANARGKKLALTWLDSGGAAYDYTGRLEPAATPEKRQALANQLWLLWQSMERGGLATDAARVEWGVTCQRIAADGGGKEESLWLQRSKEALASVSARNQSWDYTTLARTALQRLAPSQAQRAKLDEWGRTYPKSWAIAFVSKKLGAGPAFDPWALYAKEADDYGQLEVLMTLKTAAPWLAVLFLVPAGLCLRKPWPRHKRSERLQNLWPLALTLTVVMGVELGGHLAGLSLSRWLGQSGLWAGLARSLGNDWARAVALGLISGLFAIRPWLMKAILAPGWGGLWKVLGIQGRDFLRLRLWCIGLGGAFFYMAFSLLATSLLSGGGWGNTVLDAASRWPFGGGVVYQVLMFLLMVTVAPFVEEVVFRGFLLAAFRRRFGAGMAVVLTAVLFAASHAYSLKGTVVVLAGGLMLGAIRVRTRSLAASIIAHAMVNLLGYASFALMNFGEG